MMEAKRALLLAPLGVLLAGVGFAGVAAGLDDGNTIHACAKNQGGDLRMVADTDDCLPSETLVEWGVQGPQGPEGPEGDQGPQGPAGVVETHVHFAEETAAAEVVFFGVTAMCDPGEVALGGGYDIHGPALSDAQIRIDRPVGPSGPGVDGTLEDGEVPRGWHVFLNKAGFVMQELTLEVWVICAPTG